MDVQFDESEFDKRQNALVGQIVRVVHDILAEDDSVPDTSVNSLTTELAFSICSLLDGSRRGLKFDQVLRIALLPSWNSLFHQITVDCRKNRSRRRK